MEVFFPLDTKGLLGSVWFFTVSLVFCPCKERHLSSRSLARKHGGFQQGMVLPSTCSFLFTVAELCDFNVHVGEDHPRMLYLPIYLYMFRHIFFDIDFRGPLF